MTPTWPALDDKLLADSAATFKWRLGQPTPLAITPDGTVLFRRTPARSFESDLFELAPDGTVKPVVTTAELLGAVEEKLSDAEKARRERSRTATRGIVDVGVSENGATLMVPLGGVFHVIDRKSGKRTIIDPKGPSYDPRLSPDGATIAFVRDGDLWLVGRDGPPRQLTKHPEGLEYAVADFAAQEEFHRVRGYWWSPDSKSIAFQRTDARPVDTLYVADPRNNAKPAVPFKYPRAGTANAIVDLGVIGVAAGSQPKWLKWDLAKYSYISGVQWSKGGPLCATVLDRDQYDLALLAFDPATGASRTLVTEHDDAWVETRVAGDPEWLEDGSGFVWITESKGSWTLELRGPDGAVKRALTAPEFGLRSLVGLDGASAIVEASTQPTHQDVWRVPLDGSAPVRLTDGSGVANAKTDHGVVLISTAFERGGQSSVAVVNGAKHELPSVAERPSLVPTTVLETVAIAGRTHHVAITRPRTFDRARRYPVLHSVYGGPGVTTVTAARDAYVMDQWYADAGFIVVRSDNRGTPNRDRAWSRAILKDLITVPLGDQVAALQAVGARHRELDLDRVGVFGWSFGGYFATMAVLLRPDIYKAGVAGAPVTDWALYDTAYTERYMKTPQANPEGYKSTSALTHAAKLSRPLLLIHGLTDDNVHIAHTFALIEALYVAAKRAEVITLSATHMLPDPKLALAREQVQVDFFRKHLGTP